MVDMIKTVGLIVLVLIAIVVVAVGALRWRKLRHDELNQRLHHDSPSAPPAPYEVSRGVRLLDEGDVPHTRAEPLRPRLDPERQYIFSDVGPAEAPSSTFARSKHNDRWALERSFHGPRVTAGSGRVIAIVVVALAILIGIGAVLQHSGTPGPTTTTTVSSTTTTTAH